MTEISQKILAIYQVRKHKKQKEAFISFLQSHFPELKVETYKHSRSKNLILGDPTQAKILVSAHYDTCAQLPIPNFIAPLNRPLSYLYGFLLFVPIFLLIVAISDLMRNVISSYSLRYWIVVALIYFMSALIPANPHTVNDNTSGVISLCELYQSLTEADRQKVCLVFFDNEEKGLLGSNAYRKLHKEEIKRQLLINLDCVSDGDHILLAVSKKAREANQAIIEEAFTETDHKKFLIKKAEKVYYPSDQAKFPLSIAVAALKYKKSFGYYMDRIHTKRDIVMDENNIELLRNSITQVIQKI